MQRSIITKNNVNKNNKLTTFTLNFGPQHPAAHGVLRLILSLDGENVQKCDPHIGLLHRGTEKLIETKLYLNALPYFDRLDYVSILLQEHSFCLAVEKLLKKAPYNTKVSSTRTILDELTRIFNHYLALACHALDVGSMSPIFWCFEEREKIMEIFERISGARMHMNFYKPNIHRKCFDKDTVCDVLDIVANSTTTINEIHTTLTLNKIWVSRLKNIGSYGIEEAISHGLTGVMARCVGLKRDLRINANTTYNDYFFLNCKSYISNEGDSYSRFILRMYEIVESLSLINQASLQLTKSNKHVQFKNKISEILKQDDIYMENTIKHFKLWSEGFVVPKNTIYAPVESSKGEFGVFLFSDNTNKPYRCKIKSPAYQHLQLLPHLIQGLKLADLVTLIGTIDIVFGEIDR